MPDKKEMRDKARALLDETARGERIKANNRFRGTRSGESDGYLGGAARPANPEDRTVRNRNSKEEQELINEAYALDAARKPKTPEWKKEKGKIEPTYRNPRVGPMTEDTRRQTRRGVRGEASKFAGGGKVRGDGVCVKGKTKGRMV